MLKCILKLFKKKKRHAPQIGSSGLFDKKSSESKK
jgi:hypothetical protein